MDAIGNSIGVYSLLKPQPATAKSAAAASSSIFSDTNAASSPSSAASTTPPTAAASASTAFYTQAIAQDNATDADTGTSSSGGETTQQKFLNYMSETPIQRMEAQILGDMGLTPQQLTNMSPKDRAKVEAEIQKKIHDELQKKLDESGGGAAAGNTALADITASV